jgi:hypothetical protein
MARWKHLCRILLIRIKRWTWYIVYKGVYNWADGSRYEGNWKNNMINGFGRYEWPDGRHYVGEWLDNKMHNKGRYEWNGNNFMKMADITKENMSMT